MFRSQQEHRTGYNVLYGGNGYNVREIFTCDNLLYYGTTSLRYLLHAPTYYMQPNISSFRAET